MTIQPRRIVITLPEKILKDVDWLAPLEDMTRDQLICEAVKRFLKPHLEIRTQVLKAAANPGKMHGPFDTVDEMIAHMKGQANKKPAQRTPRKRHLQEFAAAVADLRQDAKAKGLDKMTMREINAEVDAARQEMNTKTRKSTKPSGA